MDEIGPAIYARPVTETASPRKALPATVTVESDRQTPPMEAWDEKLALFLESKPLPNQPRSQAEMRDRKDAFRETESISPKAKGPAMDTVHPAKVPPATLSEDAIFALPLTDNEPAVCASDPTDRNPLVFKGPQQLTLALAHILFDIDRRAPSETSFRIDDEPSKITGPEALKHPVDVHLPLRDKEADKKAGPETLDAGTQAIPEETLNPDPTKASP